MHKSKYTLDQEILDLIENCLTLERSDSYLISILHKVQERYGYLSEIHMDEVAHLLKVPTSTVFGVATFYHFFRLKPGGKYKISVCLGTACFVKGADLVLESFKTELGITLGDTTGDRLFSLEGARCLGICAMAPVVMVNDQVYSNVKATEVPDILNKLTVKKSTKSF